MWSCCSSRSCFTSAPPDGLAPLQPGLPQAGSSFDLVLRPEAGGCRLLLSDAETDAPIEGAKLALQRFGKAGTKPIDVAAAPGRYDGHYLAECPAAGEALVVNAGAAGGADLFTFTMPVPRRCARRSHEGGRRPGYAWPAPAADVGHQCVSAARVGRRCSWCWCWRPPATPRRMAPTRPACRSPLARSSGSGRRSSSPSGCALPGSPWRPSSLRRRSAMPPLAAPPPFPARRWSSAMGRSSSSCGLLPSGSWPAR